MQIGDILIYLGRNQSCYTNGKHYKIYYIDNFVPGHICGWIKDDLNRAVYFRECESENKDWRYLKNDRKKKLQKIYEVRI